MTGRGNGATGAGQDIRRAAIYTRKSTAAGLEQDFNSLDAQREACEQYIRSRERDCWHLLPNAYEDGGFTGANINRPGFQRLLTDIEAGKIDVVVVYKVDRLSRSLLDFAQVMERFNRAGAAFVSVTQNFSTADAMGRLTLNMLMSFAEFEREMIAERTRDKIAASRRKGKWTGGSVPLGYQVLDKKLVVDEMEAVVVREVFDIYLEHGSALEVARILNERGRASGPLFEAPTPTATASPTPTRTSTPGKTPTPTATRTATSTPTATATSTAGPTSTPTATPSPTSTPTVTATYPPSPDLQEPNDTYGEAYLAISGEVYEGYINPPGDVDCFKVWVGDPGSFIQVSLTRLPADYDLFLADSGYAEVARSTQRGLASEQILYGVGQGFGWYYVRVEGYGGAVAPAEYYNLQITVTAASDVVRAVLPLALKEG